MESLPFEIESRRGHHIGGLLVLEAEFLVFELQVRKWGLYKEDPEKVKVEFGVIGAIRFERGFFGDHVFIVPRRSELLHAIPGDHKGELKLKIARRYRDDARQFVSTVLQRKQEQAG